MSKFLLGHKVRVKAESPSPYHGCKGIVIKVINHEFNTIYEVKTESHPAYLSQSNRFLESDLEPA